MELETQRVWDYITDSYVHRLIRNRASGALVELPSLSSFPDEKEQKKEDGKQKGKYGPDREDELEQDKLEAMGVEYAKLMTAQLEDQRRYYEEEIGRCREELAVVLRKAEGVERKAMKEKREAEKAIEDVKFGLEKAQEALRVKIEQLAKGGAEEEARRKKVEKEKEKARKEIERELEAEREVTKALAANVGKVKEEMAKREEDAKSMSGKVEDLEDQMRDLMFALSAREQIEAAGGGEGVGGDIVVQPTPTPTAGKRKKKR
ncbi:BRCA1-associated protein, partial [Phenoliferia sp. Uapishka_3]